MHRIKVALALRERLYAKPYYRLLFGEADGIPGVVVDRYGDYLAVQITTAGMELQREALIAALVKVLKPAGIIMRNDSGVRELEGLTRYVELAHGHVPDRVMLEEGGCRFEVSLSEGQKTGWFYDQAANRDQFLRYVEGRRVLDVCSYVGAWSVRAAKAGADCGHRGRCLGPGPGAAAANASLNRVDDRVDDSLQGDAFRGAARPAGASASISMSWCWIRRHSSSARRI